MGALIYHITSASEWSRVSDTVDYWPAESGAGEFIHFSYADQVSRVANRIFRGRNDLVLIEVDSAKVESDLKAEATPPDTEKYPHLYRKLKLADVNALHKFLPEPDGSFSFAAISGN